MGERKLTRGTAQQLGSAILLLRCRSGAFWSSHYLVKAVVVHARSAVCSMVSDNLWSAEDGLIHVEVLSGWVQVLHCPRPPSVQWPPAKGVSNSKLHSRSTRWEMFRQRCSTSEGEGRRTYSPPQEMNRTALGNDDPEEVEVLREGTDASPNPSTTTHSVPALVERHTGEAPSCEIRPQRRFLSRPSRLPMRRVPCVSRMLSNTGLRGHTCSV